MPQTFAPFFCPVLWDEPTNQDHSMAKPFNPRGDGARTRGGEQGRRDLQGVVNNANYQHYMEHTRHEFLESLGVNFGKMHEDGLDAFVTKVTISYKKSLRSGDHYRSALRCTMRSPKLVFHQDILHMDGSLAARGEVECVVVDRLTGGEFFAELLRDVLPQDEK